MEIKLQNIGKQYRKEWIFRNVNHEFDSGSQTGIRGHNGSGKSTLLRIMAGYTEYTEGLINYHLEGQPFSQQQVYQQVSYCSPALELIEELTVREMVTFHSRFKSFQQNLTPKRFAEIVRLDKQISKPIKHYSSGMKQRVKLGLSILADTSMLLLDEPCSNLDKWGIDWYNQIIQEFGSKRTILICSNDKEEEFGFCSSYIDIMDFKNARPSA